MLNARSLITSIKVGCKRRYLRKVKRITKNGQINEQHYSRKAPKSLFNKLDIKIVWILNKDKPVKLIWETKTKTKNRGRPKLK